MPKFDRITAMQEEVFRQAVHYNNLLKAKRLYAEKSETADDYLDSIDKERVLMYMKIYQCAHRRKIAEQLLRDIIRRICT